MTKHKSFQSTRLGCVNGNDVFTRTMEAFQADFHVHDATDEMFVMLSGCLYIDLDANSIELHQGDAYTVTAGVNHRARVPGQAKVLVISRDLNG